VLQPLRRGHGSDLVDLPRPIFLIMVILHQWNQYRMTMIE
jgi:hypothetical protein